MTAGVHVGQPVVIRGRAIGTLLAIRDGMLVIEERDLEPGEQSVLEVPVEQADKTVRAIASREQAEQAIRILATKPERPPTQERALRYRRAYKGGDLEEQARMLAAIYAGPLEPQERQYIEQLERSVFGELALVLGVSRKSLRAQIRAATRGEAPPRSLGLADRRDELTAIELPHVDGLSAIGAFAVDAAIGVGEYRADVTMPATPGVWFAFAVRSEDDILELVAVHRDSIAMLTSLRARAERIGRAPIEGAHIAIFDEAIVDDEEIVQRMAQATFDIVDGRAAVVALGGDGVAEVSVVRDGKRAVCVCVVT
jgi:RNA polymerase-interacting CarD/CdnL/TRCF family regulator